MSVTTSGYQSKSNKSSVRLAIELVSSMRFAISLLVILAIASIIGALKEVRVLGDSCIYYGGATSAATRIQIADLLVLS